MRSMEQATIHLRSRSWSWILVSGGWHHSFTSDIPLTKTTDFPRAVDKDFAFLGLDILPNIIAPKATVAVWRFFQGFHKYYAEDGHKSGSRLVRARYGVNRKFKVPIEDIEHFDPSVCYGCWWIRYLLHLGPCTTFIRSDLFWKRWEKQCLPIFMSHRIPPKGLTYQVNIAETIAGYPLLASLVQETLRVQSTNASEHLLLKDTLLEDQYLLKRDSILLIPSAELHKSASVWGPTFKDFDPQRFMQKRINGVKVPASAYRAYESGALMCPGRYLAAKR